MEIEFNGTDANNIEQVCRNQGINVEVLPLSSRDTICPREEGRTFGNGETYYLVEESCWHGYYFCGGIRCGRTSTRGSMARSGVQIRTKPSTKPARQKSNCDCSGTDCSGTGNCDTGSSDTAGALVIIFVIIALLLFLAIILPALAPAIVFVMEIGLALLLGLFDLITFGIFRKNFKRVLVYFPSPPTDPQLNAFIKEVATFGGLPRRSLPHYSTNGFWIFRTGAYLFIPGLLGTIIVLWLQPDNGFLFRTPIITFIVSILLVWFGNLLIRRKASAVARS